MSLVPLCLQFYKLCICLCISYNMNVSMDVGTHVYYTETKYIIHTYIYLHPTDSSLVLLNTIHCFLKGKIYFSNFVRRKTLCRARSKPKSGQSIKFILKEMGKKNFICLYHSNCLTMKSRTEFKVDYSIVNT